eukprot:2575797-Prymnesium_polylepis.1
MLRTFALELKQARVVAHLGLGLARCARPHHHRLALRLGRVPPPVGAVEVATALAAANARHDDVAEVAIALHVCEQHDGAPVDGPAADAPLRARLQRGPAPVARPRRLNHDAPALK